MDVFEAERGRNFANEVLFLAAVSYLRRRCNDDQ